MANTLLVTAQAGGQKLFNFLKRSLHAENNEIHRWIRTGQVRINKKRAKAFDIVYENDEIRIPPFALNLADTLPQKAMKEFPLPIIYENEHVLIVNKPQGIACQGGTGQEENIADMLKEYYSAASFVPAPAHRLDKETQGILLIGKTYQSLRFLTECMKSDENSLRQAIRHEAKKIYRAWVYGNIADFARNNPFLCHYLCHNEERQKEEVFSVSHAANREEILDIISKYGTRQLAKPTQKAQIALSSLKCLDVKNGKSLVEIGIYTGRKHQIRVQLASSGFPLVGDTKYAPKKFLRKEDEFFLQACKITLPPNNFTEQCVFGI